MAVDYKDYYKILGVQKDADQKSIRQAYRKLARQYHPDVNPGDKAAEEKFKEINEANEVLADPEKRKKYDEMSAYYQQYGQWPGAGGGPASGPSAQTGRAGGFQDENYQYYTMSQEDLDDLFGGSSPFSDFFETYFHSGSGTQSRQRATRQRSSAPTRGEDVEADTTITLAEAYQGTTQILELSEPEGTTRRLEVKIPAGVDEGTRIRISGQGMQGGAGRGDLYLHTHVTPDARFTRDGRTLHTGVDVPLAVAMLGGEAQVTTPDNRHLLLHIPAGTSNGRTFRLRHQGMSAVGKPDERGDLYAEARVILPTHLTHEQRQLFETFARSIGYSPEDHHA